jgi:Protein of unknown function (DUF3592)
MERTKVNALLGRLTEAEDAELKQLRSTRYNQLTEFQRKRYSELYAKREQAKAKASRRHMLIGLVIAALVCFYFSLDVGMGDYKRFNQATRVAQGKVAEIQGYDDDEAGLIVTAYYKFKVNGVEYKGSVDNQDESLAEGDPVQVYYNPANPDFNHVKGARNDAFLNLWTVFGFFCLIAIWAVGKYHPGG